MWAGTARRVGSPSRSPVTSTERTKYPSLHLCRPTGEFTLLGRHSMAGSHTVLCSVFPGLLVCWFAWFGRWREVGREAGGVSREIPLGLPTGEATSQSTNAEHCVMLPFLRPWKVLLNSEPLSLGGSSEGDVAATRKGRAHRSCRMQAWHDVSLCKLSEDASGVPATTRTFLPTLRQYPVASWHP